MSRGVMQLLVGPAGGRGVDASICTLRVLCGIAFVQHGWGKIRDVAEFSAAQSLPVVLAAGVAYVQFIGGLMLVLGLLTRPSGLAIGITMSVAVAMLIRAGESFINPGGHSWESAALYVAVMGYFVVVGAGRYSLDHAL